MQATLQRDTFADAFAQAAAVAPKRHPKPILQHVKITTDGTSATLSATDLELSIEVTIEDVPGDPGEALLPVARLAAILRESTDEHLQLSADDTKITVTGDCSRFNLPSANQNEYPGVPKPTKDDYWTANAEELRQALRRSVFCCDTDSNRYALGGVNFDFKEDMFYTVGTDGRRLAVSEVASVPEGDATIPEGSTTIIPARSIQVLIALLAEVDNVRIFPGKNEVYFQGLVGDNADASFTLCTRLVEGRFPKWQDVLPGKDGIPIELNCDDFARALRQAAVVSSDESRGVTITFSSGLANFSCTTAEVGQASVELPVSYHDDELSVTLDNRFVLEFLKAAGTETFDLYLVDSDSATLFVTADENCCEDFRYVCMPLASDRPTTKKPERETADNAELATATA